MTIPYTFATQTGSIPLSELDTNFATPITLGTTPVKLGYTTITIDGITLTNPTIGSASSGGVAYGLGGTLQYTASGVTNYVLTAQGPGVAPVWAPVSSSSGGTVTSVAVTSANGFAGTVAFPTGAANITMTTTVTGLIKGNGAALIPAAAGTDYSDGTAALATGIIKSTTSTGALSIATAGTDYSGGTSALASGIVKSTTSTGALSIATSGTDYSAGTSALASGMLKSTTSTGALSIATAGTDYSAGTSALASGIIKSTTSTGALSVATAGSDYSVGTASLATGIIKSTTSTGALSVAAANTDYLPPASPTVSSGNLTVSLGNIVVSAGNLTFSGTSQRITGDFSNATASSRLVFQSSTVNGNTGIYSIPNGTSTTANFSVSNSATPDNSGVGQLSATSTDVRITSGILGTGTYLPLTFYTSGIEQMRLETTGNLNITGGAQTTTVTATQSTNTITLDCNSSNVFQTTITASITLPTYSNPHDGQTINWFITQGGTGSYTVAWSGVTAVKWAGGVAGVLSTAVGAVDMVVLTYRSATGFWYGSILKAFA